MEKQIYNWKRFWYHLDKEIKLADYGFLSDPETEWGHILNPDALSLDNLGDMNCLILLGEPGIGKSFALKKEYENFQEQMKDTGDFVIYRNISGDSNEERLVRKLITENPNFKKWANSNKKLFLFIDSFDESSIPNQSIIKILVEEFEEMPIDRLFLRITCRFSEWESFL